MHRVKKTTLGQCRLSQGPTGYPSIGAFISLSPKVVTKMLDIFRMRLGRDLQWFSMDRITGYSLVTNANSLIPSTTSYCVYMCRCICVHVHVCVCVCVCLYVCLCLSVTALASATNALKAKVRYQQKALDAGTKST